MDLDNEKLFGEVAALLRDGVDVTVAVRGRSMRPFLVEGRDSVTLRRCRPEDIRRGDVVLVRASAGGGVVLHRVVSRRGGKLTLQGDGNRLQTETADAADVAGVAVAFRRKGTAYAARGPLWRLSAAFALVFMALRRNYIRLRINAGYVRGASVGYRRGIIASCAVGLVSVMLSLAFIYFSKHLIDVATGAASGGVAAGIFILAVIVVSQLVGNAAAAWIGARLQVGLANSLRRSVFSRLMASRWVELGRFHTGDVVNRVERDTASVVSLLSGVVPAFVVSLVQLVVAFAFFCLLDPWLPWLVVCVFPVLLLGGRFYTKKMYRYTRQIRQSDSLIQSVIQESLQQRTVIKALEQGAGRVGELDSRQSALRGQVMGRTRFSVISRSFVSAAFALCYLAVFAWGVVLLGRGAITFGTMAAFLQLVGKVQYPMKNAGSLDLLATQQIDMTPAFVNMVLSQKNMGTLPDSIKLQAIEPAFSGALAGFCIPTIAKDQEAALSVIDFYLSYEAQAIDWNTMYASPVVDTSKLENLDHADWLEETDMDNLRYFSIGSMQTDILQRWADEIAPLAK